MKTITENSNYQIEIKNSKFITELIKIDNENIKDILEEMKIKYPKATHYTYALRLENYQKSSDDGEPGGTAGTPMLNVLEKEDIINVLAVTIRYFGGIKLGAGGLVRAYTKSLKEAINHSNIKEVEKVYKVNIEIEYDKQKELEYILRNQVLINKDYNLLVKYTYYIKKEDINLLNNYKYEIIKEEYN